MKKVKPYLFHILSECDFLLERSEGLTFEEFYEDELIKKAFVRSLEIIGEAVKKLPMDFRERYSYVPWKEMSGMRDKLIHAYFEVDYIIVWKTVKEEIPILRKQIGRILDEIS